jgi:hypothetical protein
VKKVESKGGDDQEIESTESKANSDRLSRNQIRHCDQWKGEISLSKKNEKRKEEIVREGISCRWG